MRMTRIVCCAFVLALAAQAVWAADAAPAKVDVDALKKERTQLNSNLRRIRDKLRKSDPEIQELYAKVGELRKQIEEKYKAADPEYAKLVERRDEITKQLRPPRKKKATPKAGKKAAAEKKAPAKKTKE